MAITQSDHIRQAIALRDRRSHAVKFLDWIRSRPEGGIAVLFVLAQLICVIAALLWPELLPLSVGSQYRRNAEGNCATGCHGARRRRTDDCRRV